MMLTSGPIETLIGPFAGTRDARKVDNNPQALAAKIEIRRHVLKAVGTRDARVFDAFAGTGELYSAVFGFAITEGGGIPYKANIVPAAGDTFTVYYGCDHTPGTCQSKFNNLANFRGFPYVPPPQMAI